MASTLDKIGVDELRQMVDFRWRVASGNLAHPFLPDAIEALFYYSEGTPREACILADNSLLLAFLNDRATIEKQTVEEAAKERRTNLGTLKEGKVKKDEKNKHV